MAKAPPRKKHPPKPGPCVICGKACVSLLERNSDGTWAHDRCLRDHQARAPERDTSEAG